MIMRKRLIGSVTGALVLSLAGTSNVGAVGRDNDEIGTRTDRYEGQYNGTGNSFGKTPHYNVHLVTNRNGQPVLTIFARNNGKGFFDNDKNNGEESLRGVVFGKNRGIQSVNITPGTNGKLVVTFRKNFHGFANLTYIVNATDEPRDFERGRIIFNISRKPVSAS